MVSCLQLTGLATASKGHDSRLVLEETLSVDFLCFRQAEGADPAAG